MGAYDKTKEELLDLLNEAARIKAPIEEYADFLEEVSGEVETALDGAREDILRKEKQAEYRDRERL